MGGIKALRRVTDDLQHRGNDGRRCEMDSKKKLPDALHELPKRRDEEVGLSMMEGRALSRSDDNLHLATPTGLLAVPLANIVKATAVAGTKGIVRLIVSNPESARVLLRVADPGSPAGGSSAGAVARIRGEKIAVGVPVGVGTCDYYDTPTVTSAEGLDASDDEERDCHADDLE
jgi:hypothetical protein